MLSLHDAPATFFDGQKASRQTVSVSTGTTGMDIRDANGALIETWVFADIRRVRDTGSRRASVFYLQGDTREARVTLARIEDTVALKRMAPDMDRRPSALGSMRKIAIWGGAAVGAVCLMIFVIIPGLANQMAGMIPPEREQGLGIVTLNQIERILSDGSKGDWDCETPDGSAALQTMATTMLGRAEMPYEVTVRVVDHEMINAFALPGGQVVIMRGLLDKADSAEEVAGVLAHEFGHVAARDPMRLTLRAAGSAGILSLVLGDATGGTVIALAADQVLSASHTRAAEANADIFALERLKEAKISPEAFAGFFDKLLDEYGDTPGALEIFASHPNLASRASAARNMGAFARLDEKVLTDTEWAALKDICKG